MNAVEALGVDARLEAMSEQLEMLVAEAEERRALRESLSELTHDLSPMASQGFESMVHFLGEAEAKGYTEFARGSMGVVDRVVTSFDEDDVGALGDNIVLILETVKEMTQPEVMLMLRTTLQNVHDAPEPSGTPSLLDLIRQMREPQVRIGLARLIVFLRSLGSVQIGESETRKETGQ
jgi:hypothetical protein